MPFYAFTLVKVRGSPKETDYDDYLSSMLSKNPGISDRGRFYEYTRRCHVHMLLYSERPIGYADLKLKEYQHGWNLNLQVVKSLPAWNRYIRKDQQKGTESQRSAETVATPEVGVQSEETIEEYRTTASDIYKRFGRIV